VVGRSLFTLSRPLSCCGPRRGRVTFPCFFPLVLLRSPFLELLQLSGWETPTLTCREGGWRKNVSQSRSKKPVSFGCFFLVQCRHEYVSYCDKEMWEVLKVMFMLNKGGYPMVGSVPTCEMNRSSLLQAFGGTVMINRQSFALQDRISRLNIPFDRLRICLMVVFRRC